MLTKLTIRNFKQFGEVEIPLSNGVVFIGPNNSGKTSALQALALWHAGLQALGRKRRKGELQSGDRPLGGVEIAKSRPGVTINRRELIPVPISHTNLMWRNRKTRIGQKSNRRIDLIVEGASNGVGWKCGLEFDCHNEDSFHCRPLRVQDDGSERMLVPKEAHEVAVAMLPPMSGLASVEPQAHDGRVNVLIGEGRTAEVLRNLCYTVAKNDINEWKEITDVIFDLFGAFLSKPLLVRERGEIMLEYRDEKKGDAPGALLDLQSAGRGMQQVMLLLAFLHTNPGSVLLLDEPDAHLEILRQQQIYTMLLDAAAKKGSQIIAASHSEVLLNEAAVRETVVAFVGKPHPLFISDLKDKRLKNVAKALSEIGHEQYHLAELRGWILYLESKTDLAILKKFAEKMGHDVAEHLKQPFVHLIGGNTPTTTLGKHFDVLLEAKSNLTGILLVDNDKPLPGENRPQMTVLQWRKREIENYLCSRRALLDFVASGHEPDLWGTAKAERRRAAMEEAIENMRKAAEIRGESPPFSSDIKASDDFLSPLFRNFAKILQLPLELRKADFHKIVDFIPDDDIDPEIREKLDAIHAVAKKAKTPQDDPEA